MRLDHRTGRVYAGAAGVHGHRDGHVDHLEFVDRFHAQVAEADDLGLPDRLGDQVGRAAHRHQVRRLVPLDRLDRLGAALGLADHADQAGLREHHLGELVHAGGRRRAGRSDHFVAHRVDGADVVDHPVGEVHRQRLALGQHVLDALVRGIAAREHLAVQEQRLAGLPGRDLFLRQRIEVDAPALLRIGRPLHLGPQVEARRIEVHRAGAVHHEVRVARGRAVGNHRHRLAGGVAREHLDLDVQHRGQAAEALGADAQRIHLLEQLQPQLLDLRQLLAARGLGLQLVHVEVFHQRFLGQQHRLFRGAADADAQHARRAPAGAHGRHGLEHPVDDGIARVEHDHLALVLAAAALGRDGHFHRVARHQFHVDDGRRVVLGVLALELRVGHHRGTQRVVRMQVAAAHAFVDGVLQAAGEAIEPAVHADLEEHVDDAGVLADGAMPHRAHLAVGEDLRDRVLGRGAALALVRAGEVGDVVRRMVVADVLQRRGDRLDEVGLLDAGGHGALTGLARVSRIIPPAAEHARAAH